MDGKQLHLKSIDDAWNKMEYKVIDMLYDYGCLEKIDKDAKIIIGRMLMKYVIRSMTTCKIEFENTPEGLFTYLSTKRYPFVIFYLDENKITRNKEILEYYEYDDFIKLLKEIIRDINQVTNYKVIICNFPYDDMKNIVMGEITKTPAELALKTEILVQHYQTKKVPLKRSIEVASKYNITLNELQIRKITN